MGNQCTSNGGAGILLACAGANGAVGVAINGNSVCNNGVSTTGGDDGIRVENNNDTPITGNVGYDTQGNKTQNYGIRITGNANYNVVTGNSLRGNGIAGKSLVGANNEAAHNIE